MLSKTETPRREPTARVRFSHQMYRRGPNRSAERGTSSGRREERVRDRHLAGPETGPATLGDLDRASSRRIRILAALAPQAAHIQRTCRRSETRETSPWLTRNNENPTEGPSISGVRDSARMPALSRPLLEFRARHAGPADDRLLVAGNRPPGAHRLWEGGVAERLLALQPPLCDFPESISDAFEERRRPATSGPGPPHPARRTRFVAGTAAFRRARGYQPCARPFAIEDALAHGG